MSNPKENLVNPATIDINDIILRICDQLKYLI